MSDAVIDPLPPVLNQSTLNLLAGASGVGKTSLIAYMAACLVHGRPLLGHQPTAVPAVGYLGADRPWKGDTELWFRAVGLSDIPHYSLVEDRSFHTSRFSHAKPGTAADIFEEHVRTMALPPGSVLFVDPIALYIGGDQNHYTKVAMGCINIQRVIQDLQLCVVGVDHSSKQKGDNDNRYTRLQDRISGSMAKLGYSATQMYLAGPEEMGEDCHTFLWNPHHAPSQTFKLKQDPETGLFRPVGDDTVVGTPITLPDAVLSFYASLPDVPFSSFSIVQSCGDAYDRATVFRYLKQLKDAGLIIQPKHGFWQKTPPATSQA